MQQQPSEFVADSDGHLPALPASFIKPAAESREVVNNVTACHSIFFPLQHVFSLPLANCAGVVVADPEACMLQGRCRGSQRLLYSCKKGQKCKNVRLQC